MDIEQDHILVAALLFSDCTDVIIVVPLQFNICLIRNAVLPSSVALVLHQITYSENSWINSAWLSAFLFSLKAVLVQVTVSSFEAMMMIRGTQELIIMARLLPADNTAVYALYNQTRPTALFLSSIFILDFACLTYANTLAIESVGSVKDFEPPPVNPTGLTIFRRGTIFKVGVKEETADLFFR